MLRMLGSRRDREEAPYPNPVKERLAQTVD